MDKRVTMDDLGRFKVQVTWMGREAWLHALSEFDAQARDEYATWSMMKRRKVLQTVGSFEHEVYVDGLEYEQDENLIAAIVAVEAKKRAIELQTEIVHTIFPFPDDADDEKKTEILEQRQVENDRVILERTKAIELFIRLRRTELETFAHDQIVALVKIKQVEAQGMAARERAFTNYTLFASVYSDAECQKRVFEKPDSVEQLSAQARNELAELYVTELDRITQLDLQYFLSTTDSPDGSLPPRDSDSTPLPTPTKRRGGGRKR